MKLYQLVPTDVRKKLQSRGAKCVVCKRGADVLDRGRPVCGRCRRTLRTVKCS